MCNLKINIAHCGIIKESWNYHDYFVLCTIQFLHVVTTQNKIRLGFLLEVYNVCIVTKAEEEYPLQKNSLSSVMHS